MRTENAQALVEYMLILAIVSLVVISVWGLLSSSIIAFFQSVIVFIDTWVASIESATLVLQAAMTAMPAIPTATVVPW